MHIPDKRQVMTRYYGWYANRPRGPPRKRAGDAAAAAIEAASIEVAEREVTLKEARLRWVRSTATAHLGGAPGIV
ncbi:MAG: hypothetical protein M3373_08240 [Gemmatimonadota bacterium]|nr:hypothetical protein [Gemmatimonadota bacterium]